MHFEDIVRKYNTFIFDNDGVILDSNQAKTEAFVKSVESFGEDNIQQFIEYHVNNGGVSRFKKIEYFYREILGLSNYDKHYMNSLSIYSSHAKKAMLEAEEIKGVIEFIRKIKEESDSIYVISGSDQEELRAIYTERGIQNLFKKVMGSPASKKTHAKGLIESKILDYPVVYFGDSITDFDLAEEYKMDFIFVSSKSEWQDGARICEDANSEIIHDFSEIL